MKREPRGFFQMARTLKLIACLVNCRYGLPASLLAQKYGVHIRTIYRDLDLFRGVDLEVVETPDKTAIGRGNRATLYRITQESLRKAGLSKLAV